MARDVFRYINDRDDRQQPARHARDAPPAEGGRPRAAGRAGLGLRRGRRWPLLERLHRLVRPAGPAERAARARDGRRLDRRPATRQRGAHLLRRLRVLRLRRGQAGVRELEAMVAAQPRMTLEQFLKLREKKPPLEYEDGEVTQKVSPKTRHIVLQVWLVEELNRRLRGRKVAMAFPELRVTFGGRSYVPDVSVFRWERLPRTPEGEWI